jgi:ferredoxin
VSTFRRDWAFARHEMRRRLNPQPEATAEEVLSAYAADGLRPFTPAELARLPAMSRCTGCGLCALVLHRAAGVRPPDLPLTYLRDASLLPGAAADMEGIELSEHALRTAAAVCPVGVPLDEVAEAVRRLG